VVGSQRGAGQLSHRRQADISRAQAGAEPRQGNARQRFVAGLEPTPVVRSGQPRTYTRNCGIQSAHQSLITDVLQVPLPPVRDNLLRPPLERSFSRGQPLDCGHQSGASTPHS
jgi:hypothetical protein